MEHLYKFRQNAICGNYETALDYFQMFDNELTRMELAEKSFVIQGKSYKQIRFSLSKEVEIVKEIMQELNFFSNAKTFGESSADDQKQHTPKSNSNKAYKVNQTSTRRKRGSGRQSRLLKTSDNRKKRQGCQSTKIRSVRSSINSKKNCNDKENCDSNSKCIKYNAPAGIDSSIVDMIETSVIQRDIGITWDDIASLDDVKKTLREIIILPTIIPEYFKGIRQPFKSVLLFGPPGTGKTMLAKAVASTGKCTFFNVSPSLILSKWRGDSSKIIRVLFEMATFYSPSVVFFDEIDAIGSHRSGSGSNNNEHEASRQLKSELLIQMDGVNSQKSNETNEKDKSDSTHASQSLPHVMVLAATNHPWSIDQALRRRLEKRIYIPLPDANAREKLFSLYLKDLQISDEVNFQTLSEMTHGYNGADINAICRDASMISMRKKLETIDIDQISNLKSSDVESPITKNDFVSAISRIKSSVSSQDIQNYTKWFDQFGSI